MKLLVSITLVLSLLAVVRDQTVRFWPKSWKEDVKNVPSWFRFLLQGFGCISSLFGLTVLPLVFVLTYTESFQWWVGALAFLTKSVLGIWTLKDEKKRLTRPVRYLANFVTLVMWAYLVWYLVG